MKKIAALCMKPSIDISTSVGTVVSGLKLRCKMPKREPGGGGINVSRAITKLGGKAEVLFPVGGTTGSLLMKLLKKENVGYTPIPIENMVPESLMVLEESSGKQYRFNFPGASVKENEWKNCLDMISRLSPKPDFVVASGSLPPGVPDDFYARAAREAKALGAKFVLDTHGPALIEAAREGVYLIKANMKEFQDVSGQDIEDETHFRELARKKILEKNCEIFVVSLGAAGAILVSKEGIDRFCAPLVPIRSRVGAGDSMVAGMVMKLAQDYSLREAMLFGIASGSAAVITPGTELCRREDAERLFRQLKDMDQGSHTEGS
jgi:6-phosphofructokinase 2